jgi:hypothetical protein
LSKNSNAEGFVMAEYKPEINENWKIYSRVQGLYAQNLNSGEHARSYLMLRLGLSYKDIRFGLGANWDAYGPEKQSKQNYGVFLAATCLIKLWVVNSRINIFRKMKEKLFKTSDSLTGFILRLSLGVVLFRMVCKKLLDCLAEWDFHYLLFTEKWDFPGLLHCLLF